MDEIKSQEFVKLLEGLGMIKVTQKPKAPGYMTERDEVSEFVWGSAQRVMCGAEDHEPMAFFFSEDKFTTVRLGPLFTGKGDDIDREKSMAELVLHSIAKKVDAQVYAFVCGAWVSRIKAATKEEAERKQEQIMESGGVSKQADKREVLMVVIETNVQGGLQLATVKRGKDGKVKEVVRTPEEDSVGHASQGRFANILKHSNTVN